MASTDSKPVPQKNVAYRHYFDIRKNDGTLITSWTGADSEVSKDGAAFADCTNEATEIGTSGVGYIDFTSTEMNADSTVYKLTVTNTGAMPVVICFFPEEAGDIRVNATQWNSLTTVALPLCPTVAGRALDVTAGGCGGVDWANVEAPTTALALTGTTIATTQKVDVETIKTQTVTCAAGVTVNTNVGTTQPVDFTGTGSTSRQRVDIRMIQGDDTVVDGLASAAAEYGSSGTFSADLKAIKSTALTETSVGYLAASFINMHNVASPVFTTASVNQTGNSYGIVNDGTNGNAAIKTTVGAIATVLSGITSLAQWLGLIAGKQTGNTTARTELRASGAGSGTYDETTDSLEAIKDAGSGGLDAAGVRAAIGLASANLDTQLADIPTVSEFNARTLVAADYFDPATDTVANVTTVGTTTNLTNLPSIPANWLTAAGLASDAVTEIQSGLASQSSVDVIDGIVDTILVDTNELQTNQGNWLTATGFATPTNVSDSQTAIIAQVDANETKIDTLTTTVGAAGAGLSALPWNAAWNAEVQSEVADAINASPPVDGSGVGIYSVAYAALALTHSNRSSATTLLVKSANGTTIGTHTLTEDDTLDPVSVVGDGS